MIRLMKIYRFLMMALLINALLSQTFPKTLVLVDYYFHTSVYAAYCVNKDMPEMHCDGQCQLDKKMDDMDHHHDSSRLIEISFSTYVSPSLLSIQTPHTVYIERAPLFYRPHFLPQDWVDELVRPPQFLV